MTKWISVEDRLPEEDDKVLIFTPSYPGISIGYVFEGRLSDKMSVLHFPHDNQITHWMPFPLLPSNNEENTTENHKMTCAETFKPRKYVPSHEWISVKDRLPPENTEVVTYESDGFLNIGYRRVVINNHWYNLIGNPYEPSHWMPLPELPKP